MLSHSRLAVLMVVLILHDEVHAGRIVGGREAVPHSRPYMVLLEGIMDKGDPRFCGGFLLSEDFMMTAAHCQAKNYNAWVGVHDKDKRNSDECVQKMSVEEAFPHPHYNNSYVDDIMILRFGSKVQINQVVQTISLADQDDGSLPSPCSVSGWGVTDWNQTHITNKLMEVNVTLINDNYNCSELKIYCSKENVGPGKGDSGGPLVCDGKAYGVASTLYKKPFSNEIPLAIYTIISEYKEWINSVIKEQVTPYQSLTPLSLPV